jgi:acyl-CoA dehydrogenase
MNAHPFAPSSQAQSLLNRLDVFMRERVEPQEQAVTAELATNTRLGRRWTPLQCLETLKEEARAAGLWNLFLPEAPGGAGLSNLDYAPMAERMGRVLWASEVFNCSAPDTGNMEVLARYGTPAQKECWLEPLLAARIRSAFAMTEPEVASSDATNISTRIEACEREGRAGYLINGRKWWISGAGDPRCAVYVVMGKSNPQAPRHQQQSMILVPADTPGVQVQRTLPVFGHDDAPHGHCEMVFSNAWVPADHLLLGEGRGFEIAQGRLGPGRIHHCMRLIGQAERAFELTAKRLQTRVAFGKPLAEQSVWRDRLGQARCSIDQARLLTLNAAWLMDRHGNKVAANAIAMIKVAAPSMACEVIDWAIQAHGGAGVSDVTPLAAMYGNARALRLADGPDEVHRAAIAKSELRRLAVAASA